MSASPSAPVRELSSGQVQSVAAVVYASESYPGAFFEALVDRCRASGLSVAGVLQHLVLEDCGQRCDVLLEDLTSGHRTALFEDRGAGASGCRLDQAALAEATARVEGALEQAPDILVLSKFGKVECEGGGLRDLIAGAIDRRIPVVIGVPRHSLDAWRDFAGELAVELSVDASEVDRWLAGQR